MEKKGRTVLFGELLDGSCQVLLEVLFLSGIFKNEFDRGDQYNALINSL